MKRSFGRSAAALVAIGVIAKVIGALYRVPLTNTVGAEGMGLYQMVFPVYSVLLAFCGGGVTGAVSHTVAKYSARGREGEVRQAVSAAFFPVFILSVLLTGGVALLRGRIAELQGNEAAALSYLALCPSLLFAAGIGTIRGYFQGRNKMVQSGVSQLVEQTVKLALGLTLGSLLMPRGVEYAVAGALLGVTASEAAALLYLFAAYSVDKKRSLPPVGSEGTVLPQIDKRALVREIYSFAMPVTLSGLAIPLTQLADSVLVINLLMVRGADRTAATALFGLAVGPVGTLINMPTVAVASIAAAFLPALTAAVESGDGARAQKLTSDAARWIMLAVVPVTVAFFAFPEHICMLLYGRGLSGAEIAVAAQLLRIQAPTVFFAGALQLATTALQAHGLSKTPALCLAAGAGAKIALTLPFVAALGVHGSVACTAACYGMAAALTLRAASDRRAVSAEPIAVLLPAGLSALGTAAFFGVVSIFSGIPAALSTLAGGIAFVAVCICGYIISVTAVGRREKGAKKRKKNTV